MQPTTEAWRAIPGYEGRYLVSDLGRVRSVTSRPRTLALHPRGSKRPYLAVSLRDSAGRRRTLSVHLAVLAAFIGPRPEGNVGRHLNGDLLDNRLKNLAYGTPAENTADSILHGTNRAVHEIARQTHCKRGHEYTSENTSWRTQRGSQRRRVCVTCRREGQRASMLRDIERYRARQAANRERRREKARV